MRSWHHVLGMPAIWGLIHPPERRLFRSAGAVAISIAVAVIVAATAVAREPRGDRSASGSPLNVLLQTGRQTSHLEYVFDDGAFSVFDIDRGNKLIEQVPLAQARGIRG